MPPWSDVRTLAQSLMDCDDYVTFLDVLPLQRLAHSLIYMPEPTLEALWQLHKAPQATLGAKDGLLQLLRNYHSRAQGQRALAQKTLRLSHDGQSVRLQVGQKATVVLLRPAHRVWHVQLLGQNQMTLVGAPPISIVDGETPGRQESQLVIEALAPGVGRLQAQLVGQGGPRNALQPARTHHGSKPSGTPAKDLFYLIVIVEPAAKPA